MAEIITIDGKIPIVDGKAIIPPSGGGLPSSISKIDGGEFTFASDTPINSVNIPHNLGLKPKGYAIWSVEVSTDQTPRANTTLAFNFGCGEEWNSSSGDNIMGYEWGFNKTASRNINESRDNFLVLQTDYFRPQGFLYYQANATYKWLAWA